ncbi:hypothetical protein ABFB09_00430 [Dehalogenimonas sp. THU2]|uniref:hypothetical protein n=1 Tax=Dehalogenimonas sp. THU2 TaxID=3151121 RepID=UPI00321897EF
MGFIRGLVLGVVGILLFLSLLLLGVGLSLNFTVLNPGFINGQIERLDVADVFREAVIESGTIDDTPRAIRVFLDEELPEFSDEMKAAVSGAVDRFYDYLHGRTDTLDLQVALGETVFAPELVYSLADRIDWPDLAEELIQENTGPNIDPIFAYLLDYIDNATVKMEDWYKDALRKLFPPMKEYLLGTSQSLDIFIPLDQPLTTLYITLLDVYNRYPPPELSGLTLAQKQAAFDDFFFFQLVAGWPTAIEIDSSFFAAAPESINQGLDELKADIEELKKNLGYYWFGFYGLFLLIALLIGAAYLMLRERRKLLLYAGIIFFIFGLIGFVGVMVTNAIVGTGTDFGDVPSAVQVWLPGLVESALRPILFFSIFAGAVGITGVILSHLHPHSPNPKF